MDYKQRFFPDLVNKTYLNHAAISPLNIRCRQAMNELIEAYGTQGVKAWGLGNNHRIGARRKLARLMGAGADDIALTGNTSQGLSIVACEYPWQKGDTLVLIRGEFPGNVLPWLYAARRFELEVLWLELNDLAERNERFLQVMERRPRLLAVSWVQYQTGYSQRLAELSALREQYDLHICLDAIQGLGPLRLDLGKTPFDFVTSGTHKWLLSPEGTGFLYVHPERMAAMRPTLVSWISQEDAASFLFRGAGHVDYEAPLKEGPRRYETATMNAVGFAGLDATLDLILEVGPEYISTKCLHLAEYCREGLANLGLPVLRLGAGAGNVCTPMEADRLVDIFAALDKRGVIVSTPDGHLRVAAHFYNEEADIDHFLQELGALIR